MWNRLLSRISLNNQDNAMNSKFNQNIQPFKKKKKKKPYITPQLIYPHSFGLSISNKELNYTKAPLTYGCLEQARGVEATLHPWLPSRSCIMSEALPRWAIFLWKSWRETLKFYARLGPDFPFPSIPSLCCYLIYYFFLPCSVSIFFSFFFISFQVCLYLYLVLYFSFVVFLVLSVMSFVLTFPSRFFLLVLLVCRPMFS